METIVQKLPYDFCATMTPAQDEAVREMLEHVADKWPLAVLQVLAEAQAPLRFSRVLERVEGISQKVLTQTLRMLERNGFLTRTLYPQVPPRVEYAITPLGDDLLRQISPLWHWILERLPTFESNRTAAAADGGKAVALPAAARQSTSDEHVDFTNRSE
jgi:DNA-binding HxlR family transcriptional regulator